MSWPVTKGDWQALESSLESLEEYLGASQRPDPSVLPLLTPSELRLVSYGVYLALKKVRDERARQGNKGPLQGGSSQGG